MNQTAATLLSLVMLAAFALAFFGIRFALAGEHRRQGLLMLATAVILVANVLVWVV
jgi:hypothetical protein